MDEGDASVKFKKAHDITSAPASAGEFTPGVWRADILGLSPGGLRATRFTYAPQARSHWHVHEGEQALLVTDGRGIVAVWDEPEATLVLPGDWVHVEPGQKHWHGAGTDDVLLHIAVTASGGTQWLEPVTTEQYEEGLRSSGAAAG